MDLEQKYQTGLHALKEYASTAGFTDVVIGLSGGIDSSLTAVMCVEAFGADHVHGFMLPGPYSTDHSLKDARDLADNLGIETQVISILEPYEGFERALHKGFTRRIFLRFLVGVMSAPKNRVQFLPFLIIFLSSRRVQSFLLGLKMRNR